MNENLVEDHATKTKNAGAKRRTRVEIIDI